jgi:hypothetical protein
MFENVQESIKQCDLTNDLQNDKLFLLAGDEKPLVTPIKRFKATVAGKSKHFHNSIEYTFEFLDVIRVF